MKKITISILIIGLLLTASFVSTTAFGAKKSQEKQEIMKTFSVIKYNRINDNNIDGFIDPIFLETWKNDTFAVSRGSKSTIYDGYMYQLTYNSKIDSSDSNLLVQQHVAILKYDVDTGDLIRDKTLIITDDQGTDYLSKPRQILFSQNYIYMLVDLGVDFAGMFYYLDGLIIKFDTNLNMIDFNTTRKDVPGFIQPEGMANDDDGIYITGYYIRPYPPQDNNLFLLKFDHNLNLIWNVTWGVDGLGECVVDERKIITTCDNHVFITASNSSGPVILKYDPNGNLVKSIKSENGYSGYNIVALNGKLYASGERLDLSAYDTDLNFLWKQSYDDNIPGRINPFDIIAQDSIYVCGEYYNWNPPRLIRGFVLKCDINNNGTKDWLKFIIDVDSDSKSINGDNNYLYLSGTYWGTGTGDIKELSYVVKCTKDGGDGDNIAVCPPLLDFGTVGKWQVVTKTFTIENNGESALTWTIKDYPSWVKDISPKSGSLDPDGKATITVTINTGIWELKRGKYYEDSISIESTGGNEEVKVMLKIVSLFDSGISAFSYVLEEPVENFGQSIAIYSNQLVISSNPQINPSPNQQSSLSVQQTAHLLKNIIVRQQTTK